MTENEKTRERRQNEQQTPQFGFPGGSPVKNLLWIALAVLFFAWMWGPMGWGTSGPTPISYTKFRQELKAGKVERVQLKGDRVQGQLKAPEKKQVEKGKTITYRRFLTYLPAFGDPALLPALESQKVEVDVQPNSGFSFEALLIDVLPFLLLIWLGYYFFSRMHTQGQNLFSVGKNRARLYEERSEKTTFEDVAGARAAKGELQEIVSYLEDPSRFQSLGGKAPRGVLLVGPPGTGKTLLARAVAGEAGVPFFSITGSDFMEMFVGVGASRVRNMFQDAKKQAPSIIFIDEMDSIGRRRGAGLGGGHDEREQTLNQLLSEMDGFESNEGVIVVAATNRPDILDPALLRPGRFDRRVTVDLPSMKDREEILALHARNKPLSEDINLEDVARGMPGSSGADLENILNEAALMAARQDKKRIERVDLEAARDKILMGLKREGLVLTEEECRRIAYHEAGHALVAAVLPHTDPLHKVSIVPRGRSMGVTQQIPSREMYVYPKPYLTDRLSVMMGGRAAEEQVLETVSSGAENDLKEATRLARKMVLDWGMSEHLGHLAFGDGHEEVFLGETLGRPRQYSEETAREIDGEIRSLLDASYGCAARVLGEYRGALDRVAEALLDREEISGEEVFGLVKDAGEAAYGADGDGKARGVEEARKA